MKRVNRQRPCPICGKPDWCLAAEDNSAAICQRIQEGSVKRCGDAGWLHILIERNRNFQKRNRYTSRISIDFGKQKNFNGLSKLYQSQLTKERLLRLSNQLKISAESLTRLNIGWDGKAYTFPMSDDTGKTIGIRRRFPNGAKVSVQSSKAGLFIPLGLKADATVLICEGATDTAAAIDLGVQAIGRPNCNSLIEMTAWAVRDYEEIVIVADNDAPGRLGAGKLADYLSVRFLNVKVIFPPEGIKDLRQWFNQGLTSDCLKQFIEKTTPVNLQVI